jgi:predicted flap endonuclease-1-like 5' DNA nuclease
MRVLKVFFLGLVYGWFLRWIMDMIFLRDEIRILSDKNAILKQRIQSLEAPRSLAVRSTEGIASAPLPVEEVTTATKRKAIQSTDLVDNLKMIKGIGPQIEKKLHKSGVHTFEELSRLSTDQLKSILGKSKLITQNADNMLTQAKKFAQQGPKG